MSTWMIFLCFMGALHDSPLKQRSWGKGARMVTQFAFQVQLDGVKKGLEMKEREVSGKRGDFECNGLDGRDGTPEFPEESGAPVPWASTVAKRPPLRSMMLKGIRSQTAGLIRRKTSDDPLTGIRALLEH